MIVFVGVFGLNPAPASVLTPTVSSKTTQASAHNMSSNPLTPQQQVTQRFYMEFSFLILLLRVLFSHRAS